MTSPLFQGRPATLEEILAAKEARVRTQQRLLSQGGGCCLLSFTLNCPGAVKQSLWLHRGFEEGLRRILGQLRWKGCEIRLQEHHSGAAGEEAFLLLPASAEQVKAWMVELEEADAFGRLLDIDVLNSAGEKLSRTQLGLPPRRCLLCEEMAAVCARSRRHSYEALRQRVQEILTETLSKTFADRVASCATKALLYEVSTTPKPGLVDRLGSGAHKDMDYFTFLDSAAVLTPYFREMTRLGASLAELPAEAVLPQLRGPGKVAEREMLLATGGVNCHKGLIFSLGILCAALGRSFALGESLSSQGLLDLIRQICQSLLEDFSQMEEPKSHGERLYRAYGHKGIRGEASAGFPAVGQVGLPALKAALARGESLEQAGLWALLSLMAHTQDSNVLSRGGPEGLRFVQESARGLLEQGKLDTQALLDLDRQFCQRNLSPGGCADLLALCYFLYFLDQELVLKSSTKERED